MTEKSKQSAAKAPKGSDTGIVVEAEGQVPEADENFEHTLRRLVLEREQQRAKNFGLYR
ncbi:hypothetical protein [Pseudoruegeria sp. HB172150]|uniref:hypothetical protein n=1 Tax=Pseudoruegeria sp. HB172150 TaxID=2721164 RepID=UPI001553A46D|nr:hypothetical protein [Pseudoruegeria sp. HB172150]